MKSTGEYDKIRLLVAALALAAAVFGGWGSDSPLLAQTPEQTTATASFKPDEAVSPDTKIEVALSRALRENEKIAFLLGRTDVTNLFSPAPAPAGAAAAGDTRFIYDAGLLPLPAGNSNLTVFLVGPTGIWKEIARLPLAVTEIPKTESRESVQPAAASGGPPSDKPQMNQEAEKQSPEQPKKEEKNTEVPPDNKAAGNQPGDTKPEGNAGEDKGAAETKAAESKGEEPKTEAPAAEIGKKRFLNFLPAFTLQMESQPFQSNFPLETRPATRATFTNFNLTGTLKSEGKVGPLTTESNFDFAGSSFKEKTLRFGTLGEDAPDVDLASYLMNLQIGKAKVSVGHTSFGSNRHLVSSFSSRGVSVNVPINKRFDVTGGVLNGTSVLGFGNFFGVSKVRHQVQGVTLGAEFFPERPGAMRLEISGFNGYLQALNGVSEGRVVDAERSRGFGLRFLTTDQGGRFKLEAGYALSRFFNPQDSTLDPDGTAVPLPPALRSAHYAEASYQLLKDVKLTAKKSLNLGFGFKYEYVEPLYRSLGASASADKFSREFTADASVGEITFQAAHARSNDNLAGVPSILKLVTHANRLSVALPLSALIGQADKPSPFLPRLGYSVDRTHNFGAAVPVNGGFEIDLASVPDLLNTNQTFSSAWQLKKLSFEYTYNRSYADNRQAGSEAKDQLGWVHGVTVGVNPLEILALNAGLNFDSQRNFELDQVNRTKVLTLGVNWQPFKGATFAGDFSRNLSGDAARTSLSRNINFGVQFAYNFNFEKSKFRKYGIQSFVRFADAFVQNRDFVADLNNRTRTKILTAGVTFNFF